MLKIDSIEQSRMLFSEFAFVINGTAVDENFGYLVSASGNGIDHLIVAVSNTDPYASNASASYMVFGRGEFCFADGCKDAP